MEKIIQIGTVITAGVLIAIADSLIKKSASMTNNLISALINPLMFAVLLLYVLQIALLGYIFIKKWELSIAVILEITTLPAIVIAIGILYFREKLTFIHQIGILIALIGAILMNI